MASMEPRPRLPIAKATPLLPSSQSKSGQMTPPSNLSHSTSKGLQTLTARARVCISEAVAGWFTRSEIADKI